MRILILAVAGSITLSAQQPASRTTAEGQEARVCGTVETRRTNVPLKCDATLVVKQGADTFEVIIPARLRGELPVAPERLVGAEACFTGAITRRNLEVRLAVASASAVNVTSAPPADAFGAGAVLGCEGNVTLPEPVRERKPEYTSRAMRAGVQGTVEMEAVVDADGHIRQARVIRALDPELDQKALEAVREWQFRPGVQHGKPVPVVVVIEMTFALRSNR